MEQSQFFLKNGAYSTYPSLPIGLRLYAGNVSPSNWATQIHDLGHEICESAIKLLKCVVLANGSAKKDTYLNRLVHEIEVQWALLRLLYELRAVSSGQFKILSERLSDITKQSQAWLKWVKTEERKKTGLKKSLAETPRDHV